jgi:U3 small nucleolar ribonucleoprotein protein IMP4
MLCRGVTYLHGRYRNAGLVDPSVLVTTSRKPSSRLQLFAKEMTLVIPNSRRINRGTAGKQCNASPLSLSPPPSVSAVAPELRLNRPTNATEHVIAGHNVLPDVMDAARDAGCASAPVAAYIPVSLFVTFALCRYSDVVVLHETRGDPDGMVVSHLPLGPTLMFTVGGTVLRHDIDIKATAPQAYPHLVFDGFAPGGIGKRVRTVLQHLFPEPKPDAARIVTFANRGDNISVRHHIAAIGGREVSCRQVCSGFF